jgi:hypothetical protein
VPLPEIIAVRYTEEEAGYISVRPVVKQNFRQEELVDMILRVTGKDPERIRQILRSGTVVYNFYRYWWTGFDAGAAELNTVLGKFPSADASRAFRAEECDAVLVEFGGGTQHQVAEFTRHALSRKRFLHRKSLWDSVIVLAESGTLEYQEYSYARRADLYRRVLAPAELAALVSDAAKLAPRDLRLSLHHLPHISSLTYSCPRR